MYINYYKCGIIFVYMHCEHKYKHAQVICKHLCGCKIYIYETLNDLNDIFYTYEVIHPHEGSKIQNVSHLTLLQRI